MVTDIRALTVRRPWADLIAHHGKRVENRSWSTSYRGRLLIHAGQGWDPQASLFAAHIGCWPNDGYGVKAVHPEGIVAVAELVGVCPGLPCECGPWAMPESRHWLLGDVRALADPVPATGALGLWRPSTEVVESAMAGVEP